MEIEIVEKPEDLKKGAIFEHDGVYKFGMWCPTCEKKIDGCFCAKKLEDAKRVIQRQEKPDEALECLDCWSKSKRFRDEYAETVKEMLDGEPTDEDWHEFAVEIAGENPDDDQCVYPCECPLPA